MELLMWWSIFPSTVNEGSSGEPGLTFEITLPYIGNFSVPLGNRGLPVSQYIGARLWSPGLFMVVIERMTVYLSATLARLGISSQTSSPGKFVLIGLNSPL